MKDPTALAAQEAAQILISLGWPVKRHGDDMEMWRIGDAILTVAELVSFAAWAPNPLQEELPRSAEAAERDQPRPFLGPIDALASIRAIIDVAADPAAGTEVEPAIRLIRGILDGALPTRRRGTPAKR